MALVTITASDILYRAFRYAGILRGPMRGLSGSEQQEGVSMLNSMLDAYSSERAWVYSIARVLVPINANQQDYVIGQDTSGGIPDWYMPRPETIQRAGFLYINTSTPTIEVPFEIYTDQQWDALSPKPLTSTICWVLHYQPFTASGANGIVNLWPIPTNPWQAALYLWQTVSQVAGPDDVLNMPAAYDDALSYGLAVRLAPLYPQVSVIQNPVAFQEIQRQAAAAKQRVRTINFPNYLAQCEFASMGTRSNSNYGLSYSPLSNSYK